VQFHQPVLLKEVRELLQARPGDILVDCNLGTGGHSLALLEDSEREGHLVGLDLDHDMIELAHQRFRSSGLPSSCYSLVHADHGELARVMGDLGLPQANKILLDLGCSSLHLDLPERGFSFTADGPLDMRYDRSEGKPTAASIVNSWPEAELARLFRDKSDERWAARIARRLAERRETRPFTTTADLAAEVAAAIPRKAWPPKIHPATRVFLALRVEVNGEDRALRSALEAALELLAPAGRLAVITFQSHEDQVVKRLFRQVCRDVIDEVDPYGRVIEPARFRDLTRHPVQAGPEEERENPRARSAKLRAIERK